MYIHIFMQQISDLFNKGKKKVYIYIYIVIQRFSRMLDLFDKLYTNKKVYQHFGNMMKFQIVQ